MQKVGLIRGFSPLSSKKDDKELLSKLSKKSITFVGSSNSLQGKFAQIKSNVESYLKLIKGETYAIRDDNELDRYLEKCIQNGIISIDTETTGLDCLEDKIIGVCIYTPGEKAAYIPILHESYISGNLLSNQIGIEKITNFFEKVRDSKIKVIMFNAKFDLRMIHSNYGVYLTCYWDCYIASKLIQNNLKHHTLKDQYRMRICPQMKKYNFESLFSGVKNATIPVDIFTPYAAGDAIETYQLYEWQDKRMKEEPSVYSVMMNIEMPLLPAVCDMEDRGVNFDFNKAKELHEKYTKLAAEATKKAIEEISKFKKEIKEYNDKIQLDIRRNQELLNRSSDTKKQKEYDKNIKELTKLILPTPINISSPKQLSILFYDVLGYTPADNRKPRGTGVEDLQKNNTPLCKAMLEVRKYEKLLSTYIDKLPLVVNKHDHRLHASFNQVGTDTGRFSSQDPNLQNIPARGEGVETREMFIATEGYTMFSSDFSQQEPRITAGMSGDRGMIDYYKESHGKKSDLYAYIASVATHKDISDCLEFYPAGTKVYNDGTQYLKAKGNEPNIEISTGEDPFVNKEGKKMRKHFKAILLGRHICPANSDVSKNYFVNLDYKRVCYANNK